MYGSLNPEQLAKIGHNADLLIIMAELSDQSPTRLAKPDLESIEQFVLGKKKSIPGAHLRIEYADNAIKLFDAQNVTIAVSKQVNEWQQKVLLYRHAEAYFGVLTNQLTAQGFLAAQKSRHPDFAEFSKYQTPSGYHLQHQAAQLLGQAWLDRHSRSVNQSPNLLVFQGNSWYPIQELKIDRHTIHLRTLVGEISISTDEKLVWIEQIAGPKSPPKSTLTPAPTKTIPKDPPIALSAPTPASQPVPVQSSTSPDPTPMPQTADLTTPTAAPVKISRKSEQGETLTQLQNSIKLKALERIVDYLNDGEVIISTEVLKNGHDQIISTKTTEIKRHCPRWVIEQVRQF